MAEIYLDWAATAPPDPAGLKILYDSSFDFFGNPSSPHLRGREAREQLENARGSIAGLLGAETGEIFFTSGATESSNLIFGSLLTRKTPGNLVVGEFEHSAVWEPARLLAGMGWKVKTLPVSSSGSISSSGSAGAGFNLEKLEKALDGDTALVSIMGVNNETGLVLPQGEIAGVVREAEKKHGRPILFFSDTVQALGKIPLDLSARGPGAAAGSGHKIGAPRGTGLAFLKKVPQGIHRGGGQEGGFRNGTENLPGILALAAALKNRLANLPENLEKARGFQYFLVESLEALGARFAAPREVILSEAYSPWILWASFPPVPGEVLVRVLDEKGVRVSTGSACSSRSKRTFRVTRGLGLPDDLAFSAIRISWGPETREEELLTFTIILKNALNDLGLGSGSGGSGSRKTGKK